MEQTFKSSLVLVRQLIVSMETEATSASHVNLSTDDPIKQYS